MKRTRLNALLDTLLALSVFGLLQTGLLMTFVLPPGSGKRLTLAGLGRHGWGDIHLWTAVVMLVAVALHLVLHWKWVFATAQRVFGGRRDPSTRRRRLAGVITAAATVLLTAGFWVWAASSVTHKPGAKDHHDGPEHSAQVAPAEAAGPSTLARAP